MLVSKPKAYACKLYYSHNLNIACAYTYDEIMAGSATASSGVPSLSCAMALHCCYRSNYFLSLSKVDESADGIRRRHIMKHLCRPCAVIPLIS